MGEEFPHYVCDGCYEQRPISSHMYTCRQCNFNLCVACAGKRSALYHVLKENKPLDDNVYSGPQAAEVRQGITWVETLYMGIAKMSKRQLVHSQPVHERFPIGPLRAATQQL